MLLTFLEVGPWPFWSIHHSSMSVHHETWDSRRHTIRPEAPVLIIKELSRINIDSHAGQTNPSQSFGHTKEIHYSRRRCMALHLRLNLRPEGSQIRTPGGGPRGEDLPQIFGSPADPGCFPYWPKGQAWHRFLCSPLQQSSIGMWQICVMQTFLITHLFIFYKKDLVCEWTCLKGKRKCLNVKQRAL